MIAANVANPRSCARTVQRPSSREKSTTRRCQSRRAIAASRTRPSCSANAEKRSGSSVSETAGSFSTARQLDPSVSPAHIAITFGRLGFCTEKTSAKVTSHHPSGSAAARIPLSTRPGSGDGNGPHEARRRLDDHAEQRVETEQVVSVARISPHVHGRTSHEDAAVAIRHHRLLLDVDEMPFVEPSGYDRRGGIETAAGRLGEAAAIGRSALATVAFGARCAAARRMGARTSATRSPQRWCGSSERRECACGFERAGRRPAPLMAMVMDVVGFEGGTIAIAGASNRHRFDAPCSERVQVSDTTRVGDLARGAASRRWAMRGERSRRASSRRHSASAPRTSTRRRATASSP